MPRQPAQGAGRGEAGCRHSPPLLTDIISKICRFLKMEWWQRGGRASRLLPAHRQPLKTARPCLLLPGTPCRTGGCRSHRFAQTPILAQFCPLQFCTPHQLPSRLRWRKKGVQAAHLGSTCCLHLAFAPALP